MIAARHTHANREAAFVEHALGVVLGELGKGHEGGAFHVFDARFADGADYLELAERISLSVRIPLIK